MKDTYETEEWSVEDIDVTEEPEKEEADVITYEITHYPADYALKGYLDKWDSGQLEIPEFQRNFVWGQVQASKLIESFLLGLPVPPVFLYKQRGTNRLYVIDGQQRIFSAIRYFKNQFNGKTFPLKEVAGKWEGKTFKDLDQADKYQLEDTVLRAIVVQQLDPKDDTSIYHIFERLNTGGVNLNPMEIRKCVYFGEFFNLLDDLNKNDSWRRIIGKAKLDKRFRDVEFILRILALHERWQKYQKPMKQFLNDYMIDANKLKGKASKDFLSSNRKKFEKGCDFVLKQLGERPFHLRGRLNYAVMDSTMNGAFEAMKTGTKDFGKRFHRLAKSKKYYTNVTINTSDEKTVQERFSQAMKYLVK
jgi:hypothetical protein